MRLLPRPSGRTRVTALAAAGAALTAGAGTAMPATAATAAATAAPSAARAAAVPSAAAPGAAAPSAAAPGAPGALSHFALARKDCVGTARGRGSKVWFTVADGVLSDVYSPTVDTTNVETMQFAVTDGRTFTDLQARDLPYTVRADPTGMACTVTATSARHGYRLVTTYIADPARDTVLARTRFSALGGGPAPAGLRLYVRLDPTVGGHGGGGTPNGGADHAVVDRSAPGGPVPVAYDTTTGTSAANRDYAVPTYLALRADTPPRRASAGYAGTASDGLTMLDRDRTLTEYGSAPAGNVVLTAEVTPRPGRDLTLALGFGRDHRQAVAAAGASLARPFAATLASYVGGWLGYDATLRRPPAAYPGLSRAEAGRLRAAYYLSVNVLKASEDKTFPGAVVASLASPWGQAVSAGETPGGRPVYFGSYREIFARDLYEAFTGLLAAGDLATARDTVRFLFTRQQLADGRMPRNSLLNGRLAPDSGGDQLDQTAYPILMARQAGLSGDRALWPRVRAAADFLVAHGPSFGVERWEEQSGYSPSTIAAQIAGLVAAGRIARVQGDAARSRAYLAAADHFRRHVRDWTVTSTGPYAPRYFLRLSRGGDPDAADAYNLGNGGPTADQREVVDQGFLELTRLGILPAGDPDVVASLPVVDRVLRRDTPSGPGFYRYGTASAGTEDGYGDCHVADPTDCAPDGRPWPTGNTGSGHVWPVLSGERAQHLLDTGDAAGAAALLLGMDRFASGVGLVPEQAWENAPLPRSPYGTDPATASIGFASGEAAGSASPLTWAQAQEVRLALGIGAGRSVEQPADTRARYLDRRPPGAAPLTVAAPAEGAEVTGDSVTVRGTTAPGARVEAHASNTDTGAPPVVLSAVAAADGSYALTVPVSFGTVAITVTATAPGGATGYARRHVVSDTVDGRVVLDIADPDGDDNGPGTYAYPTAAEFRPGAFDLQRFQVVDAGDTVYLRTQVRDLSPTFGSPIGAQLLDVYVRAPGGGAASTAAAFPSRNYTVAGADAWTQRIEVQGFAAPVWVDAAGASRGSAAVRSSAITRTITVALPAASFGTPGPGWVFTVVLTGQDGFSPDQARGFAPEPRPYQFGVCAPGGTAPVCAVPPDSVPRALDVLTPAGVDQAAELDPTRGPVRVRGVPVS
jgi:glucoamylase